MRPSTVSQVAAVIRKGEEQRRIEDKSCGTCKFYRPGDVTPVKPYENMGLCTMMMQTAAPFWAARLTFTVVDWQGASCAAWQRGSKPKRQRRNRTGPL